MTKHFAVPVSTAWNETSVPLTQIRQHAPEDGESSGRLPVQLVEGGARQLLQVVERTRGRGHCAWAQAVRAQSDQCSIMSSLQRLGRSAAAA